MPPEDDKTSTPPPPTPAPTPTIDLKAFAGRPVVDFIEDADLKKDPSLATFKSFDDLARSYSATKKLVGADAKEFVKLLPADATPEQQAEYWGKLGRPAEAKDYTPPAIEKELQIAPESVKQFATIAHSAGLTNKQFTEVVGFYAGLVRDQIKAASDGYETLKTSGEDALRKEWGDKYDANLTRSKRAMAQYGDDAFRAFLDETGMGSDPRMVKVFAKLGQFMEEDAIREGRQPGSFGNEVNADQARAQIQTLQADRTFMSDYLDGAAPGHALAVRRMEQLFKQANPQ